MEINNPGVDLTSAQTITGAKTFSGVLTAASTFNQGSNSSEILSANARTTSATVTAYANNTCNATSGPLVLTLPVATASSNARIIFTKSDATANTVTIQPQAGGTIGGAATYVLTSQYQSVTLLNINSTVAGAWVIVGKT